MNKKIFAGVIFLGLVVILIFVFSKGLVPGNVIAAELDDSQSTSEGVGQVVDGNNEFAFDLYNEWKNGDGNVFFSPYSISTALAMTYEGAKGETSNQMRDVLNYPEDDLTRQSNFARIQNILNKQDKEYKLHTANALWLQKDYSFLDSYLDVTQDYYYAEQNELDFMNKNSEAVDTINGWVEDKTEDKIKDIISELSPDTRLVLTNAIYFKGDWLKEFDKDDTLGKPFITDSGVTSVDMMYQKEDFNYAETDELQILEMDYKGEELSMMVLLPKENYSLSDVEINNGNVESWSSSLVEEEVHVYFPKFEFDTKYGMVNTLNRMGMVDAFIPNQADFSGMEGSRELYIGNVIHQAYVKVDEKGTEAAAATVVGMVGSSMPSENQIIFNADHEFVFLIKEKSTGQILFLGKVVNPNE